MRLYFKVQYVRNTMQFLQTCILPSSACAWSSAPDKCANDYSLAQKRTLVHQHMPHEALEMRDKD